METNVGKIRKPGSLVLTVQMQQQWRSPTRWGKEKAQPPRALISKDPYPSRSDHLQQQQKYTPCFMEVLLPLCLHCILPYKTQERDKLTNCLVSLLQDHRIQPRDQSQLNLRRKNVANFLLCVLCNNPNLINTLCTLQRAYDLQGRLNKYKLKWLFLIKQCNRALHTVAGSFQYDMKVQQTFQEIKDNSKPERLILIHLDYCNKNTINSWHNRNSLLKGQEA